jgi:hypothetical protein
MARLRNKNKWSQNVAKQRDVTDLQGGVFKSDRPKSLLQIQSLPFGDVDARFPYRPRWPAAGKKTAREIGRGYRRTAQGLSPPANIDTSWPDKGASKQGQPDAI